MLSSLDYGAAHWERLKLASGKRIDVLRVCGDLERRLEVCPCCASELVQPIWWEQAAPKRWRVALWCPACDWETHGVYHQDELDRFDAALDRGVDRLLADLRRLTADTMEAELAQLRRALGEDLISPDDFRRSTSS